MSKLQLIGSVAANARSRERIRREAILQPERGRLDRYAAGASSNFGGRQAFGTVSNASPTELRISPVPAAQKHDALSQLTRDVRVHAEQYFGEGASVSVRWPEAADVAADLVLLIRMRDATWEEQEQALLRFREEWWFDRTSALPYSVVVMVR